MNLPLNAIMFYRKELMPQTDTINFMLKTKREKEILFFILMQ